MEQKLCFTWFCIAGSGTKVPAASRMDQKLCFTWFCIAGSGTKVPAASRMEQKLCFTWFCIAGSGTKVPAASRMEQERLQEARRVRVRDIFLLMFFISLKKQASI